jgi:hypothetical protein
MAADRCGTPPKAPRCIATAGRFTPSRPPLTRPLASPSAIAGKSDSGLSADVLSGCAGPIQVIAPGCARYRTAEMALGAPTLDPVRSESCPARAPPPYWHPAGPISVGHRQGGAGKTRVQSGRCFPPDPVSVLEWPSRARAANRLRTPGFRWSGIVVAAHVAGMPRGRGPIALPRLDAPATAAARADRSARPQQNPVAGMYPPLRRLRRDSGAVGGQLMPWDRT